jgi:hypothetical protein
MFRGGGPSWHNPSRSIYNAICSKALPPNLHSPAHPYGLTSNSEFLNNPKTLKPISLKESRDLRPKLWVSKSVYRSKYNG